jgi:hypothetical protein
MDPEARVSQVHFVKSSAACTDGALCSIDWKAVEYVDGKILFELRDVMIFLTARDERVKPVQIHEYLRFNGQFAELFAEVGEQDSLVPSIKACKSRDVPPHPRSRQEYQIGTAGLVALLLHQLHLRHVRRERQQAGDGLRVLLEACSLSCDHVADAVQQACDSIAGQCQEQILGGSCIHLRLAGLQQKPAECQSSALWLRDFLAKVFQSKGCGCQAMTAILSALVKLAGGFVDRAVLSGTFQGDVMCRPLARQACGTKRMRVDEDYRRQIVNGTV